MRHLLSIIVMFACVGICRAQYENSSWEKRIGHGKDSIESYRALTVWTKYTGDNSNIAYEHPQDFLHPNAFDEYPRTWNAECYKAWQTLVDYAPHSLFSLYASGAGGDMLRYLLHTEQDPAIKLIYFDDLVRISEFRVDNLKELNSIRPNDFGPQKKSSLADVKVWLAHYYFTEGKNLPKTVYSPEKAYTYFVDAMKEVRGQKDLSGTEVEDYLVVEYFNACKDLYLSNEDKYLEQFLQDFLDLSNTCKRLYETANDITDPTLSEQQFNKYFNTYHNVRNMLLETKANDRANIEKHFKSTFEANKNNQKYLSNALDLMMQFDCVPMPDTNSPVDNYARQAYKNNSDLTYYGAIAYALLQKKLATEEMDSVKRVAYRHEMRDAFDKALSLTKNNSQKAEVNFIIAQALSSPLDPMFENDRNEIEKWEADQMGVINYCELAIDNDPDHYGAAANLLIERTYSRLGNAYYKIMRENNIEDRRQALELYNNCITYANQASAEAERSYNAKIFDQGGQNMPTIQTNAQQLAQQPHTIAQSLSGTIRNYEAQMKKRKTGPSAAQLEQLRKYNEYMARKKAEADFWAGK